MKNIEKKKYKIIYDKTASGFEKKLNKAIDNLEDYHPEITIDGNRQNGFLAYLVYTENYKVPECLSDELEIRGINITCSECPYIQRSDDHRKKWFKCPYANNNRTSIESPACNKFYEDLIKMFLEYKNTKQIENESVLIPDHTNSIPVIEEV